MRIPRQLQGQLPSNRQSVLSTLLHGRLQTFCSLVPVNIAAGVSSSLSRRAGGSFGRLKLTVNPLAGAMTCLSRSAIGILGHVTRTAAHWLLMDG